MSARVIASSSAPTMRSTPGAPAPRRDQRELVAAQAREVVDLADRLAARVRDGAQDGVADRVAVDVVDRLEAVEVEQHERDVAARDLRRPARRRTRGGCAGR